MMNGHRNRRTAAGIQARRQERKCAGGREPAIRMHLHYARGCPVVFDEQIAGIGELPEKIAGDIESITPSVA